MKHYAMFIFAAVAICISAASCQKDLTEKIIDEGGYTFTASVPSSGDDTKTTIGDDGKSLSWQVSDQIRLFGVNSGQYCQPAVFQVSSNGKSAQFSSTTCPDNPSWAVYPVDNNSFISYSVPEVHGDDYIIISNKSETQSGKQFHYANIMVAKEDGGHLDFNHAMAIIKFRLGASIKSGASRVRIQAPEIAGPLKASIFKGKMVFDRLKDGVYSDHIIVRPEPNKEQTWGADNYYYAAILPGVYPSNSLSFTVMTSTGITLFDMVYPRSLAVDSGDIVDFGYLADHANVAILPAELNEAIVATAGGASSNVKSIRFKTNSTESKGITETLINEGLGTIPVYASYSGGEVLIRTAAKKFEKRDSYWGYEFASFKNMTAIYGLDKIIFGPDTSFKYLFDGSGITAFSFADCDFSKVKNAEGMFYDCKQLASVDFSGFNMESVGDLSNCFSGCSALTSVDLGKADMSKITSMTSMFAECTSLASVKMHGMNLNSLQTMYKMFSNCNKLSSVDLSDIQAENLESMSNMFENCSSLTSVDLSGIHSTKRISLDRTFFWCSNLTSVTFGNLAPGVSSLEKTFYSCSNLKSVDLSMFTDNTLKDLASTFYYCSKLENINVEGFDAKGIKSLNSAFMSCTKLKSLDLSGFSAELTNLGNAFTNCLELESINLRGLNTSNVYTFLAMFSGCKSLTELDVSSFDLRSANNIGSMFSGCRKLKNLTLGVGFDPEKVSSANRKNIFGDGTSLNAYMGVDYKSAGDYYPKYSKITCTSSTWASLTSIYGESCMDNYLFDELPNAMFDNPLTDYMKGVKKLADKIGGNDKIKKIVFKPGITRAPTSNDERLNPKGIVPIYGCISNDGVLTCWTSAAGFGLYTGNYLFSPTANVTLYGGALSGLTTIEGLEYVNTASATGMTKMFYGCSSLTQVDISSFNTSSVTKMNSMFEGCSSLTSLDFSGFNVEKVTTMESMFKDCSSLTSLNLNSFNTVEKANASNMFNGCTKMATLTMGHDFKPLSRTNMFLGLGTANTTSEYYTTLHIGGDLWDIFQSQMESSITHYHWVSN